MTNLELTSDSIGLLDHLPLGIIILGSDMTVHHWNRCIEDWSGIKSEDICKEKITDYFPNLNEKKYSSRLNTVFSGGHPVVFSAQLHKHFIPIEFSNGITRLQQTTITLISTVGGEARALVSIQDVTEPLLSLAENRRMRLELEEVNKELDNFVYTASHDLQAPLRNIIAFTKLIEKRCLWQLDLDGQEFFSFVSKSAFRMQELLKDLLSLSRITRIRNPYEEVDFQELVSSVKERSAFDIVSKGIVFSGEKDLPVLRCDRIKMTEVFANLINNAIKFSHKDENKKTVIEINYKEEERFHQFEVKDNGIGIDPKYFERIFNIFQRLHSEEEYEGTGVGLHLIKKIVEEHKGNISVESELGRGASFFFTISKELH